MNDPQASAERTIADFGDQWSRYTDNQGWYGSGELFRDILEPLVEVRELAGQRVADIGSGTGRIVNMLLGAGAERVYAIEPSPGAFASLQQNIRQMPRPDDVAALNVAGDRFTLPEPVDVVLSIGVLHHIPEPAPVVRAALAALKPGGRFFAWVYGYEGNETYLRIATPLRRVTTRLPHPVLRGVVELLYWPLAAYRIASKILPLPLRPYLNHVLWPMAPDKRRLVIYDQLNPAYARYYRRDEIVALFEQAGFRNVAVHHRHGYSWSIVGQKPE